MTVGELINKLRHYPDSTRVVANFDLDYNMDIEKINVTEGKIFLILADPCDYK